MGEGGSRNWIIVEPAAVPERWRDRAVEVRLVPLLGSEARELLADEEGGRPHLDAAMLALAREVARGRSAREIAGDLRLAHRTVQRRVATLRAMVGARTTGELVSLLSKWGFS